MKKDIKKFRARSKYEDSDDEYYTSKDTAELFLKDFIPYLKQEKRVVCPCDTKDSEIYKYLFKNNVCVEQYTKMEEVDYKTNNPVIITNPPFSKIKEFLGYIKNNRYIFISSHFTPHYAYFRQFLLSKWSKTYAFNDWGRPKGQKQKMIRIKFFTNIPNNFDLFNLPKLEPEENKDYDISCLDYEYDKQKWYLIHTAYGKYSPNFVFRRKNSVISFIEKVYTENYEDITNGKQFELKIKDILDKIGLSYSYQPNGSQQFPDFIVNYNNKSFNIECKTNAKNLTPVWNSGLPHENMILLFLQTKTKEVITNVGKNLIDFNRAEFKKWIKEKRHDLELDFSNTFNSKMFSCYLREMMNQKLPLVDNQEEVLNKILTE